MVPGTPSQPPPHVVLRTPLLNCAPPPCMGAVSAWTPPNHEVVPVLLPPPQAWGEFSLCCPPPSMGMLPFAPPPNWGVAGGKAVWGGNKGRGRGWAGPAHPAPLRRDAEDAVYGRDGYDYDGYRLRVEFPRSGRGTGRGGGGGGGGGAPRGRYGPPSRRSEYRVIVSGKIPPVPRRPYEGGARGGFPPGDAVEPRGIAFPRGASLRSPRLLFIALESLPRGVIYSNHLGTCCARPHVTARLGHKQPRGRPG